MTGEREIFGYFDDPGQERPAHDPGLDVPCPICLRTLGNETPLKTISLLGYQSSRSYFFRAHKMCWEAAPKEERDAIEWALIDYEVANMPLSEPGNG